MYVSRRSLSDIRRAPPDRISKLVRPPSDWPIDALDEEAFGQVIRQTCAVDEIGTEVLDAHDAGKRR